MRWSFRSNKSEPSSGHEGVPSDGGAEASGVSRRWLGRAIAIGVPAALVVAAEDQNASAAAPTTWNLLGNSGTSPGVNFLGTVDSHALVVKTHNLERARVTADGLLGIGTTTPGGQVHVVSSTQIPFKADFTGTTSLAAVRAASTSSANGAAGISGLLGPAGPLGGGSTGVLGTARPGTTSSVGAGVIGHHTSKGAGVYGYTDSAGVGVKGSSPGAGAVGVQGLGTGGATAIAGTATGGGIGGGFTSDSGQALTAKTNSPGAPAAEIHNAAASLSATAPGVRATAGAGSVATIHPGGGFYSAGGEFSGPNGVIGAASGDSDSGYGVIGLASNSNGFGVYASNTGAGSALYVSGKAVVTTNMSIGGTLSKGGGSFKIDHPLAPADKYLFHSFVESPDMMNVYNGNVILDGKGNATVTMPDWFETLNRDFRYQLTPIGAPGERLHVGSKMADGAFAIAGGAPGLEVSWQVTGIRQDEWANAHRIPVEQEKPADERGTYLHPDLYHQPDSLGLAHPATGQQRHG